jgi:hypothetical protein
MRAGRPVGLLGVAVAHGVEDRAVLGQGLLAQRKVAYLV